MAEILSLSKARKAKARSDKAAQATENRIKFGRTKAEKDLVKAKSDLSSNTLDGHKLGDD